MKRSIGSSTLAVFAGVAAIVAAARVEAHPHIWVDVKTEILYRNGSFVGVRQVWTFDELYTAQATEGLDANKDGRLDRDELAELAKVNMEGLKEFDYFTFARLGTHKLTFGPPTAAFLEHVEVAAPPGPKFEPTDAASPSPQPVPPVESKPSNTDPGFWQRAWNSILGKPAETAASERPKVLALTFELPFNQPVLAEAEGFEVSTYDPSFFIWLEMPKNGARISAGAPAECSLTVNDGSASGTDVQKLGEAFFNQVGGASFGASTARSVAARCQKS